MVDDDPTLPVGECHEADPDSVAIGDRQLQIGLRGQLADAPVNRLDRQARHIRRDCILRRCLAQSVTHIGQRQCQHLVAQGLVQRRQAIELEETDDRPQRQAVDEEREQHKAGGENGDLILRLGIDAVVLGYRQRQRQGDRSPQPAPGDRELIGGADLLTSSQGLELARACRAKAQTARNPKRREVPYCAKFHTAPSPIVR